MSALLQQQILDDYKEVLETEAGKRVFGSIFSKARLNDVMVDKNGYMQGIQALALCIANTLREVDPFGVAKCEVAYKEMKERFDDDDGRDDNRNDY